VILSRCYTYPQGLSQRVCAPGQPLPVSLAVSRAPFARLGPRTPYGALEKE